jgi:hypothetical protein
VLDLVESQLLDTPPDIVGRPPLSDVGFYTQAGVLGLPEERDLNAPIGCANSSPYRSSVW